MRSKREIKITRFKLVKAKLLRVIAPLVVAIARFMDMEHLFTLTCFNSPIDPITNLSITNLF